MVALRDRGRTPGDVLLVDDVEALVGVGESAAPCDLLHPVARCRSVRQSEWKEILSNRRLAARLLLVVRIGNQLQCFYLRFSQVSWLV